MTIFFNILELIVADLLHQLIVNLINILQIRRNVLRANEFIVVGLKQRHAISEVAHIVLELTINYVVEFDDVLWLHNIVVKIKPQLVT
jgi:hypothetical protein